MALEFAERIRRIPVYPAADGYALGGDVALMASNETPYTPLPEVLEAASKALVGVNRYPDPTNASLRRALGDLHGVASARIAIGTGPGAPPRAAGGARPGPGAGGVSPGPSSSVYPPPAAASAPRAIAGPVDAAHRHDLAAMRKEITGATRL